MTEPGREAAVAAPDTVAPAEAASGRKRGKKSAKPPSAEGGEAYEDHRYQVPKQSGLRTEEEPSDAAAGRSG